MFQTLKNKLILFFILRYYIKKTDVARSYSDFAKKSNRFLVILPNTEVDYVRSLAIVEMLFAKDKKVSLFVKDVRVSQLNNRYRAEYIDYNEKDISKLDLPSKNIVEKIKQKEFDVVIDLNLKNDIFSGIISNLCQSKYRIGFKKENSDKFYNIQIINNVSDSAISYRNLLNSLQMF